MVYFYIPAAAVLVIFVLGLYAYSRRNRVKKRGQLALTKYAKLQFSGAAGKLRGTLVEQFEGKLRVRLEKGTDLNRFARIGESYTVLLPGDDCVVNFGTRVLDTDEDGEYIVISEPEEIDLSNRRRSDRTYKVAGLKTKINGEEASFVNMSARGAKVSSVVKHKVGSYVELYVPASPSYVRAIVLACDEPMTGSGEYTLRIQFERPVVARAA